MSGLLLGTDSLVVSPTAGQLEYNGTALYYTPASAQRGLIPTPQYYKLESNNTLLNSSSIQNIFGVGATVSNNTIYSFEALYNLARTAGTTSHTVSMGFGGTAIYNYLNYYYTRYTATTGFNSDVAVQGSLITSNTLFVFTGARTSAYYDSIQIKGTFSVSSTGGGTFIPQLKYSVGPGANTDVREGSYILLNPIGTAGANVSIGTWA